MMKRFCPFCKEEIDESKSDALKHIYSCSKRDKEKFDTRYKCKVEFLLQQYKELNTKEKLEVHYIKKKKSLPDLLKEFEIPYNSTLLLLDFFSIKKRTLGESNNLITKNKIKEGCLLKYNCTNPSQRSEVKRKKKETFLKNYGEDNIFKTKQFRDIQEQGFVRKHNKSRSQFLSEVNKKRWEVLTDEEKNKWLNNSIHRDNVRRKVVGYRSSKLESLVLRELINLEITNIETQLLLKDSGKRFFYDLFLKDYNLIIEVNGDYWHANPKLYKENDVLKYKFGDLRAKDIWNKDKNKKEIAKNQGYDVLYIWESELIENKYKLKEFLKLKLNGKS